MKLLLAIVQDEDAGKVMSALNKNGFMVTKLSSTGGFLKAGNTTLLMGVEDAQVDQALATIESHSKSRRKTIHANFPTANGSMVMPVSTEITVGGATVFIINVEDYKKF